MPESLTPSDIDEVFNDFVSKRGYDDHPLRERQPGDPVVPEAQSSPTQQGPAPAEPARIIPEALKHPLDRLPARDSRDNDY